MATTVDGRFVGIYSVDDWNPVWQSMADWNLLSAGIISALGPGTIPGTVRTASYECFVEAMCAAGDSAPSVRVVLLGLGLDPASTLATAVASLIAALDAVGVRTVLSVFSAAGLPGNVHLQSGFFEPWGESNTF